MYLGMLTIKKREERDSSEFSYHYASRETPRVRPQLIGLLRGTEIGQSQRSV